jgi:hypothetical protein
MGVVAGRLKAYNCHTHTHVAACKNTGCSSILADFKITSESHDTLGERSRTQSLGIVGK